MDTARPAGGLRIWWLGQSGFLVKSDDTRILFDPYLSDSLTLKYQDTDRPHVRMTACPIAPQQLRDVEAIFVSHRHTDHFDVATLAPLCSVNPQARLILPAAIADWAASQLPHVPGDRWVPLCQGESRAIGRLRVTAIPAAHESLEQDVSGRCCFLGYSVQMAAGTIYHAGDTVIHPELPGVLSHHRIDIGLLPINGRQASRGVPGNMFGDEAARLASQVGMRLAIPCHFEMFAFNTESPKLFEDTCAALKQPHRVLRCGECLHWPDSLTHVKR
jgi:L-ascorbate metabolism protein UlaG (beta-lactamase superfamily)